MRSVLLLLTALVLGGCVLRGGGGGGGGGTRPHGDPGRSSAVVVTPRTTLHPPPPPPSTRRVVIVGGREVPVGAEAITWKDKGGFDGYLKTCFFDRSRTLPASPADGCNTPERYGKRKPTYPPLAEVVEKKGWTPELAALHIDQLVVHYDVAWTSQHCFKVLHDQRGLSCHFLIDVDGTIYQTLDVVERARHAAGVNDRAIGVELAHPGPLELTPALETFYKQDERGPWFDLGPRGAGVRSPGYIVRPARPVPIRGPIHGKTYTQWDFTETQYEALAQLLAALRTELPRLRLAAPVDGEGRLRLDALKPVELEAHSGLLGHWHVTTNKQDPGPAFDWARLLGRAKALSPGN